MVVVQDPAPDWKEERWRLRKIKLRGWGADRGVADHVRRWDPEVRVGVPVLGSIILLPAVETTGFARIAELHVLAAGQPLAPDPDMDLLPVEGFASAGEFDRISVFRVDHGAQTDRVSDVDT